uniref:ATP synthase subunit I n=1 Tax=uncultured bacterium CBNPD1 BAC clone 2089 TaxID=417311 RepID=B1N6P6_9BACT|nr:conserved hypothetical protein [uncultured bacterium CBNPD1 BAC clone 2089]
MNAPANPLTTRFEGPAPEAQVTRHMLTRGAMVIPVLVAIAGFIWGADGALGCLYGVALVFVNFALVAGLISLTARISLALMMGAVLFGYLLRLGIIFLAVILVRDAGWVSLPALGFTIIVTHLGLLFWELRHVSATLAFPGLKPQSIPPARDHV